MTRTIAYCCLVVFVGVVCVASLVSPDILSDRNLFLKNFVNHELLAILSVIVSITLASTSALHLELNKIEERRGRRGFQKTRAGIRQAAYFLILLLSLAVCLVFLKAGLNPPVPWQAFFNGMALFLLFWNVLILISITQAVFAIAPDIPDDDAS
ncbi:hypothetical protein [Caulobacter sp. NIBR1757]|uniref:hypothetical protein n=1 Tax=Caulobacter sp. NIBR1757 TaxID=3016000 RepID=UPI0022F14216|nr:hypothetical protein [Caulobacter sp. NIBR1757]